MSASSTAVRPQSAGVSRRSVVAGAAVAGAAAALPLQLLNGPSAQAAPFLPPVRHFTKTRIAGKPTRHMANRFAYGYTPALRRAMRAAGSPLAWFNDQLKPAGIDDRAANVFDTWFPTLDRPASRHWELAKSTTGYPYEVAVNHARWSMLRRVYSKRQVLEVMTEFWLNHLHVYNFADTTWLWRQDYDAVIRANALGRFDKMLQAAIVHPTMLSYLDADLSMMKQTRAGPVDEINENLGRELLELHTVGRSAGYTEEMVKDSARILTGWTIDRLQTWDYGYDVSIHSVGPVKVLDFESTNANPDGRQVLVDLLQYLAHHPATAQRIARKLALRFVSDAPSQQLIDDLAQVFLSTGTDIRSTLLALVEHPEFLASAGTKVRTPTDDVCATLRVLGPTMTAPTQPSDGANAIFYLSRKVGQTPFDWGPPDGFPQTADAWATPGRMMGSYNMHHTTAGHYYPSTGMTYREHSSWLPQPSIRFDEFVDHLCRLLHGRSSTSLVLGSASICVDVRPDAVITRDSGLIKNRMPMLLGFLLDTPQHLKK